MLVISRRATSSMCRSKIAKHRTITGSAKAKWIKSIETKRHEKLWWTSRIQTSSWQRNSNRQRKTKWKFKIFHSARRSLWKFLKNSSCQECSALCRNRSCESYQSHSSGPRSCRSSKVAFFKDTSRQTTCQEESTWTTDLSSSHRRKGKHYTTSSLSTKSGRWAHVPLTSLM